MAHHVLETMEPSSSSFESPMSELPGGRIDPNMCQVAPPAMPEETEVEGGYKPAYAHLAHLPLLSLLAPKANAQLRKQWERHISQSQRPGTAMPLETTAAALMFEPNILARFTRWTIPAADLGKGNAPWFVDMLEAYLTDPNSKRAKVAKVAGNLIAVRSGLPGEGKVTLKFLDFEPKVVKAQQQWHTKFKVKELCETLVLVDGRAEVPLEVVARIQRTVHVSESIEIAKQFEKEWHVPVLRA